MVNRTERERIILSNNETEERNIFSVFSDLFSFIPEAEKIIHSDESES